VLILRQTNAREIFPAIYTRNATAFLRVSVCVQLLQFAASPAQRRLSVAHRTRQGSAEFGQRSVRGNLPTPVERSNEEGFRSSRGRCHWDIHAPVYAILLRFDCGRDHWSQQPALFRISGANCLHISGSV